LAHLDAGGGVLWNNPFHLDGWCFGVVFRELGALIDRAQSIEGILLLGELGVDGRLWEDVDDIGGITVEGESGTEVEGVSRSVVECRGVVVKDGVSD